MILSKLTYNNDSAQVQLKQNTTKTVRIELGKKAVMKIISVVNS